MISLRKWLLKRPALESALEKSPQDEPFDRTQVAACVVLLEVARSDDAFSTVEQTTLSAILEERFRVSGAAARELIDIAGKKREESVDLWEFTNLINQNFTKKEKIEIVEAAWRIIYADENLDRYEDHLMHRLAKLLQLRHSELIEAKMRVKYGNPPEKNAS